MDAPADAKDRIRARALEMGFAAVGFARPADGESTGHALRAFLADGRHGDMGWMAATPERRESPRGLWPETASVIVLALDYGPPGDPLVHIERPERGVIAAYAKGRDYHFVAKKMLNEFGGWIARTFGCQVKHFVDTAPVMEKPLAQQAGLGWQGKHTNLVSREHGSWLFLCELFTDMALEPDEAGRDSCGSCHACIDACPTHAITAPYRLDARRCISYLTIEHKGTIPEEFREAMGNRIYGCDDCLAACPWNKYAQRTTELAFLPRIELTAPKLLDLVELDDESFRDVFSRSPIKRLGRARFVRNVLIAIGNTAGRVPGAVAAVRRRLDDEDARVRAMAVWALAKLNPDRFDQERAVRFDNETDPDVCAEWRAGSACAAPQQRLTAAH
ncbi:MAG TPA: tRNA epoxyqueuosine(34) reductase QueG [Alphaproteobacteria bacterium]|jgi:epoxyqueuosine reductase|nr:tRNA epoxyqueuosine(34) reductase QueG [Alphaproteobacteria bacterium]